jgi:hypothetical protein
MTDYIKSLVDKEKSHILQYNDKVSDCEFLYECFHTITCLGVDGQIKLKEAFPCFCEFIKDNYPKIDLLEVLDYAPNIMSFDYYVDDYPDTMIAFMLCLINHTWDKGYTYNWGDQWEVFKIFSKEQCHNIYQGIYVLIVKMGCSIEPEYSRYINRILRMQYKYDLKPNFEKEENKRFPKYLYDYFYSLLFLFKHGKSIETIQKNALLNYITKKRSQKCL